ncbi:hypothetical protein HZ326_31119 [Fusarium oxysporum f. sp. albedinis]|nr:hypothetical protein HZ326_31119 [Fusarium oxysporum f. sp. albedinis]
MHRGQRAENWLFLPQNAVAQEILGNLENPHYSYFIHLLQPLLSNTLPNQLLCRLPNITLRTPLITSQLATNEWNQDPKGVSTKAVIKGDGCSIMSMLVPIVTGSLSADVGICCDTSRSYATTHSESSFEIDRPIDLIDSINRFDIDIDRSIRAASRSISIDYKS